MSASRAGATTSDRPSYFPLKRVGVRSGTGWSSFRSASSWNSPGSAAKPVAITVTAVVISSFSTTAKSGSA